jgi:hypothetical protein
MLLAYCPHARDSTTNFPVPSHCARLSNPDIIELREPASSFCSETESTLAVDALLFVAATPRTSQDSNSALSPKLWAHTRVASLRR